MTLLQSRREPPTFGHVGAEAHAERVDRVLVAHARKQPHDRGDVAAEDLNLFDLRRRDHAAVLRLGDVDLRAARLDRDRLADGAHLQRQRSDRQPFCRAEDDVFPLERAEVVHVDSDRERSGLKVGDLELTPFVADANTGVTCGLGDHRDRRAGNDLSLLVGDRSGNDSRHGLCSSRGRRKRDPRHDQDDTAQSSRPGSGHRTLLKTRETPHYITEFAVKKEGRSRYSASRQRGTSASSAARSSGARRGRGGRTAPPARPIRFIISFITVTSYPRRRPRRA